MPETFGNIAKLILHKILDFEFRVDFVCDTYTSPSIKDIERDMRASGTYRDGFIITGAEQNRPKDFSAALRSPKFKSALLQFLLREWQKKTYKEFFKDHVLFVGCESQAYCYKVEKNKILMQVVPNLFCTHE